ncbi:ABC transporter-like protein [Exophiala viscosa]|uniref:ABC transporter-like protein n=1 Tax=Exophiala viscosa TaxID=2486360 RepID=A0AAN6E097_9EURO|nr:ABC transporter-like protein [Exophiala viscosa]
MRSVSAFEENYCAPNNTNVCLPGFYCPNSNATNPAQYCPPTEECLLIRSSKGTCGPQGTFEPKVCSPGFYCPSPGKTIIECPKGFYCPQGSVQPIRCAPVSLCPTRSRRQVVMLPVYVTVALDIMLIFIAVWFYFFSKRKIHKKPQKKVKKETLRMPDHEENNLHPFLTNEPIEAYELTETPEIQRLMQSFRECIGADNVGLSFTFEGLSFEPVPGKQILSGISGAMQSGSFWAVMGGSGAGKSTFLNVLMGKTKHTGGSVLVNGHHEKMKKYKKLIGYVPQDDIVLPELTVRENILHSARIRLPRNWTDARKQEHVDTLIACLGLSHVADSLVGDPRKPVISGGQRKRVSIGLELAAAPMALFLDEPTSGLDATSAASVMGLLRSISSLGVTTIAIIHQPRQEVFESIDNLLLLGNGRELYAGPTKDVSGYFNKLSFTFPRNRNPADVVMDIMTGNGQQYTKDLSWRENSVPSLIDKWQTTAAKQEVDSEKDMGDKSGFQARTEVHAVPSSATQQEAIRRSIKKRGASYPLQVWFCFQRAMLQQLRNINSFFFEVGVGALAGAVIGMSAFSAHGQLFRGIYQFPFTALSSAVDYQSAIQIGLLGGLAIGLAASAAGVKVFGDEKLTYWREAAAGHNRYAYYIGKVLSTLVRMTLSCLHFSVCLGVLATPMMSFGSIFAANLLYFYCIYGFSSCISMVTKREDGPLLAVMGSLIIGILGGVAPPLSKVKLWHMEWLWRMSPGTWFTEIWFTKNVAPLKYLYILDLASAATGFKFHQSTLDMCILFLIGTIYRLIACALLVLVKRHKQR